jgi:hypothetical protein
MNAYGSRTKRNRKSFSRLRIDQDDQPRARRASFGGRFPFIRILKDEDGQMLPWMAFLIVAICGMAGLTIDLGRAYGCYRELQTSTDAAAMAGAYQMTQTGATSSSVSSFVSAYSSAPGGANASPNLPGVTVTTTFKCLNTLVNQGIVCTGAPTGYNALQVKQTMALPTIFIRALGAIGINSANSMAISTTSTAAMQGASNKQYNVAIVLDTTASMKSNDTDASCNNTRIHCALAGVQSLLRLLSPCAPGASGSSCPAFDRVSLFTYPTVEADKASQNGTCPGTPTVMAYTLPGAGATWTATDFSSKNATYQLADYSNDYSSSYSNSTAYSLGVGLSNTSQLAIDAGAKSGCAGLIAQGGVGTYFAGAINAAQSSLIAAQSNNKGSLNAMIILSDGDASATASNITGSTAQKTTVVYGSQYNQCQQAIAAAQAATAAGTTVSSIAYGASSSGCSSDVGGSQAGISPCLTMRWMASSGANFYSDATSSQNPGQCYSGWNPNLDLNTIFKHVAATFTQARLLPDSTT